MSIGKRLYNLVRSNVNHVIDRAASGFDRARGGGNLEDMSEKELEAELERRRKRREAAERAAEATSAADADGSWDDVSRAAEGGRYRTTGRRTGSYRRPFAGTGARRGGAGGGSTSTRDPRLAQLYAQLECPYGSDLTVVRKHYRAMMRKYHPDMHSGHPDKQRIATDLSQRLTMAYNELRRLLSASNAG